MLIIEKNMILKIFTQQDNEQTDEALELGKALEQEGFEVEYLDLDQSDTHQLAEIFDVYLSPSFVITQNDGREISSWKGSLPPLSEIKNYLSR